MDLYEKRIRRRKHVIAVGSVALLVGVAQLIIGFSIGDGPVVGRVIDVSTGNPIAGAIVVARWQSSTIGVAHSTSYCVHVETAVSDQDGRYQTARWWHFPPIAHFDGRMGLDAYRPGYESVAVHTREAEQRPEDVYMKPFSRGASERLEFISYRVFSGMSCASAGTSMRNLFPLFRDALKEARPLASTPAQKTDVEQRMRWIAADAWLALPSDAPDHGNDPLVLLPSNVQRELQ